MRTVYFAQILGIYTLILVFAACNVKTGNSTSQKSTMKDSVVYAGCQDQIRMVPGNVAILKLDAIQGTGYQWVVKEPSPLLLQMNQAELEFTPSESKEGKVGEGVYQVLRFKAMETGEAVMQLEYKRTFETGVEKKCIIRFIIAK